MTKERFLELAALEDGCDIGVGGLLVDLGLYKSPTSPSQAPKMYCANCGVQVIDSACDCPFDCYEPVYLPSVPDKAS